MWQRICSRRCTVPWSCLTNGVNGQTWNSRIFYVNSAMPWGTDLVGLKSTLKCFINMSACKVDLFGSGLTTVSGQKHLKGKNISPMVVTLETSRMTPTLSLTEWSCLTGHHLQHCLNTRK